MAENNQKRSFLQHKLVLKGVHNVDWMRAIFNSIDTQLQNLQFLFAILKCHQLLIRTQANFDHA